ncbi:hypothetical protein D7Y07_19060 [Bacteroides acidifaciens]|uniref:Uncharacterized protein n=2 Tax=Bacteroides acidifaciens TaxID=85831 RepID=A0A3L8A5K5_9BACE|nr:hypothetical protein D7Y07_19060 [Bacteroides acidifaciens]
MLPLIFNYKGWQVTISDDSGIFTFADMKVKVEIEIAVWQYAATLYQAYIKEQKKKGLTSRLVRPICKEKASSSFVSVFASREPSYSEEAHNYYLKLAEEFAKNKRVEYSFNVNGGMFDRFMGQNISAVEKAKQRVIAYIDDNLGNAWELFLKFIRK